MSKIQSVAEAQRRAKKRLPKAVYQMILAGTQNGVTRAENVSAYEELGFRARTVIGQPPVRDLSTTVLGQTISLPVIVTSAAAMAVAPGGEATAAKGAAMSQVGIAHSNFSPVSFESVVAANPKAFFQLYWAGNKDKIADRLERMKKAGAKALVFTADGHPSDYASHDWESARIPMNMNLATILRYAPTALTHPKYVLGFLRHGGLPNLTVPNMAVEGERVPTMVETITEWAMTPFPTWDDIAWLRELWGGPFMVKGVWTPDDARRCVDAGATAVSVSNHGGNGFDGTPATIRALPAVAEAVGDQIEVLVDGGVRRGGDVAKALALGAKAVLVGRPYFWGLAAGGANGVHEVLEVLRTGLDNALIHLDHGSVHELNPDDLIVPDGFVVRSPSARGSLMSAERESFTIGV